MANEIKVDLNELDRLSKQAEKAGEYCRTLHKTVQNKGAGLVPDQWEGDAAKKFSEDLEKALKALDDLAQNLEKTPAVMSKMTRRLAEGHAQSKKYLEQAGQEFGAAGGTAGATGASS